MREGRAGQGAAPSQVPRGQHGRTGGAVGTGQRRQWELAACLQTEAFRQTLQSAGTSGGCPAAAPQVGSEDGRGAGSSCQAAGRGHPSPGPAHGRGTHACIVVVAVWKLKRFSLGNQVRMGTSSGGSQGALPGAVRAPESAPPPPPSGRGNASATASGSTAPGSPAPSRSGRRHRATRLGGPLSGSSRAGSVAS